MERLRSLTRLAGLALPALLAAGGLGCATTNSMTEALHSVRRQVLAERPVPASQVQCLWERRLAQLHDPTTDGRQSPGLPGQVFLLTPAGTPAEADGDLAVVVYDDTPRPAGAAPHTPEIWHFDKNTLARLGTTDERFGKCFALFLPWPASWKDVTQVRIQARYESKPNPALFAAEQKVTLDFSIPGAPVWTDLGSGRSLSPTTPSLFDTRSVPDPQKLVKEAARQHAAQREAAQRSGGSLFPASTPVQTGGSVAPASWPTTPPPGPTMPSGPAAPSIALPGSNQPPAGNGVRTIIIPTQSGL